MKERIFRDYGQLMGSNTENLTIVQTWRKGLEVNTTLLVSDPLGVIAYISDITIPQGSDNIVVTKVNLRKPMLPGRWQTSIVHQDLLVAKTSFMVIPEIYNKRILSPRLSDDYVYSPYPLKHSQPIISTYQHIIEEEAASPRLTANELRALLSTAPTSELSGWTDLLVDEYWKPFAACYIGERHSCDLVPPCNQTDWSSVSPDPKSEIGPIDPQTGKIYQLYTKP